MEFFKLKKKSKELSECVGEKLLNTEHHDEIVILEFERSFCILKGGSYNCYGDIFDIINQEALDRDLDVYEHSYDLEEMGLITQEEIDVYEANQEEEFERVSRERDLAELERLQKKLGLGG